MVKGDHELNRSRCKVCKFLKEHRFAKAQWDNEVNRGDSLGQLQTVLRTLGLEASKSTISRHLTECEGKELYETKTAKVKRPFKNLSHIFSLKPELNIPSKCEHKGRKKHVFNVDKERVEVYCAECNKLLTWYNPEDKPRKRRDRVIVILNALKGDKRK